MYSIRNEKYGVFFFKKIPPKKKCRKIKRHSIHIYFLVNDEENKLTHCKVGCNYLHDIVVFIQKDKHLPLLSFNNNKYNSCVSCSIHFYDKLFQLSHKTQRNVMACYKMIYRRVLFPNELNEDLFKSMFY